MGTCEQHCSPGADLKSTLEGAEPTEAVSHVERLVDDLRSVRKGGHIRIFCGEANPDVYNDSRVIGALQDMQYARRAKIRIISGPFTVVDESGFNGILYLKSRGVISDAQHRAARGSWFHYHYVETTGEPRYSLQFPHPPMASTEDRRSVDVHAVSPSRRRELAKAVLADFDAWRAYLATMQDVIRPLMTTAGSLRRLAESALSSALDDASCEELLSMPGHHFRGECLSEGPKRIRYAFPTYRRPTGLEVLKVALLPNGHQVDLKLPDPPNGSQLLCHTCLKQESTSGASARGQVDTSDRGYRIPDLGIAVRFQNVATFLCENCGSRTMLTQASRQMQDCVGHLTRHWRGLGASATLTCESVESALGSSPNGAEHP